ncbi:DNA replication factor C, large subunit [Coniophora puteana RWD-64-598 SS2]|uniref:Replication factor C subunit 1 n=1 Tax=Coniophora puteana (strain RWD-64-598) TaxID=741705 RepID=A0A5M3MRQ6_CONPW|nr:DNA replication factor C, large subunit [Coniophora puteana RWD-64-598 SS2]EIW81766.1 DNA replication factor C, large subunit [Coniophora puteana RWD-64-598 SS2]
MPPKNASPKKKPQGADLRSFFGGAGAAKPSAVTAKATLKTGKDKAEPIEISEDEGKPSNTQATPASVKSKPPVKSQPTPKSKSERVMVDSDDEPSSSRKPRNQPPPTLKRKKAVVISSDEDEDSDEPQRPSPPPKKKAAVAPSRPAAKPRASTASNGRAKKRKDDDFVVSDDVEDDDDFEEGESEDAPKKKIAPKGKAKATPKETANKAKPSNDTPKAKTPISTPKKKADTNGASSSVAPAPAPAKQFNWAQAKAAKLAGPSAPGSKQVPDPQCDEPLLGLTFVFTGELSSFSRDEAQDLAKRHGGRVTGQPSSKTSFVVLGDNAGPSKVAAITKNNLKTLNEDEFLELIGTRVPDDDELDEKTKKKREKDKEAIRAAAKEIEKRERHAAKDTKGSAKAIDMSSALWTTKYAPQNLKEICGNKGQVEKLQQWLKDWKSSYKSGFKKPGKNGMNIFRAVLITGPPGIGKTTSAHMCARLEGFTPIEMNASDVRSKRMVESGLNINNTSLDGWMGGPEATNASGVAITDRSCLIMDEVDGMSAGDRGGVGALNALIKKSRIPIICIANDRGAQKLKPLIATTFNLPFRKPDATAIRSRMMSIAYKEKMQIPPNVVDALVQGSQSDIRQVLNMLSTWRLSNTAMTFDEGKNLAKINEKYSILTPFDVTFKMLGPYMFSNTARETLGDKMELYFHDHSFVPLFIQENYLKTDPVRVRNLAGPEKALKQLQLMDKAAASISDGDLVDSLIHGPEQHWSLMPLHAVCSTVRPAYHVYGPGGGYGSKNPITFPQYLGQNSKMGKLSRQLTDVQVRMRLKVSGDKSEIRQSYIPALFPHIVKPLIDDGSSAVDEVIERMDEYFVSREDWDTIVELGVGEQKDELVLKKIPLATKTALTRKYNSSEHPIPFHKATDLGKVPKRLPGGPAPDLEEAFDADDEVPPDSDDEKKSKDEDDISGDKLIQQAGAKGKGKAKAKAPAKVTSEDKPKGKASTKPKAGAKSKNFYN